MRRARAALTCALTLLPVAAQHQQQPPQPTFRAGVDVVAVDVHVVDGTGRPVPGLRPEDFAITVSAGRRASSGPRTVKTTASVTVTYAVEPKLGILVPAEMRETYEAPMTYAVDAIEGIPRPAQMLRNNDDPRASAVTGGEVMAKINCRATYSDFKRFETSARIVVPK